ncbi:MAG: hypothetical protein M3N14_11230 [Bacteroidota bacterium]|nr:hypothetical protein [Bacteroidota bacterium]
MVKPEAIADTLIIGSLLQTKISDFSIAEIQFFSYFSCLLALYDGKTVDDWKYQFIKSSVGSPFSNDLRMSFDLLNANNSLKQSDEGYFKITANGQARINFYRTQKIINWRIKYLETACKSLSLIPYGHVKEAISNEPVIFSANNSSVSKNLLETTNPATKTLHAQFASLKEALNEEYKSLIGPAVVWLEALNIKS